MIVFVHGAGRSGRSAWPTIDRPDASMLDVASIVSVARQAEVVAAAAEDASVVVAHSSGAIPVALALPHIAHIGRLRALVLLEPALYDIARGDPAIERHIATIEAARRAYESQGLRAYWRIVRPLMFGGGFDDALWLEEKERASKFASMSPPWGFGIAANDITRVPTIVVTGDWNAEYEAIAAALATAGAEHRVFAGSRHRPQDVPGFEAVLADALSR